MDKEFEKGLIYGLALGESIPYAVHVVQDAQKLVEQVVTQVTAILEEV